MTTRTRRRKSAPGSRGEVGRFAKRIVLFQLHANLVGERRAMECDGAVRSNADARCHARRNGQVDLGRVRLRKVRLRVKEKRHKSNAVFARNVNRH